MTAVTYYGYGPCTSSPRRSRYTITVPDNISVPLGLCVHVPCRFTTPDRYKRNAAPMYGYWFRIVRNRYYLMWINIWAMGELMATNDIRQKASETHMKLTGNPAQGDCSFSIINAGSQDGGWYYFLIDKGGGGKYRHTFISTGKIKYTKPQVILTDLPKPKIQLPSEIVWGNPATFSCVTTNICSRDHPQFFWPADTSNGSMTPWTKAESSWAWTAGIDTTFIPSLDDEGRLLTCRITYPEIGKTVENTIYLQMGYKPQPISTRPGMDCWYVDQTLFCLCSFYSWPPPKIQWNVDGKNLTEDRK
ncbi:myeloid cell surface antigen CD33-like [Sceloporus undulatus]|uniref:myeloid cell surface antigen CD33-like n=1 Tax=Sceloporus undulatus TaxID=8520 RepID=UPI001C4BD804|nr:myeloid cell surface antigen CD33-like [Sceloporus undulatus]